VEAEDHVVVDKDQEADEDISPVEATPSMLFAISTELVSRLLDSDIGSLMLAKGKGGNYVLIIITPIIYNVFFATYG